MTNEEFVKKNANLFVGLCGNYLTQLCLTALKTTKEGTTSITKSKTTTTL